MLPPWARLYLRYERSIPNHPGKRALLRALLRAVTRARPQPFAWRMRNGSLLAISPLEGLTFAWTVGWTCFQTGRWEPHVERCIHRLLEPGDAAIDIGANLGYFTAVMAQCVGEKGHVWAFEPVPATFDRLRLSSSLNGFGQVTPLAVALGDVNGTAQITFDPHFAGSASLQRDTVGSPSQAHAVAVRRLDDLVASGTVRRPQLIKIDVEGHELAVIRGALQTIAEATPSIIFEFSEPLAQAGAWTLAQLGALLSSCADYRFYEIGDDGLRPISDLDTYAAPPDAYGADLLATCDGQIAAGGAA